MKANTKAITVVVIGVAVAALSYYFLIYKPAHPKATLPADGGDNGAGTTGGGATTHPTDNNNTGVLNQGPVSVIGKKMYAIQNNVRVVSVSTGETMRIKNNGEFIGTIDGQRVLGGNDFYTTAGGAWAVSKKLVRVS